ncbi:DgyrCDS14404 [Dimorphilus gyrociliatus]|uniref:DgyrCDS14404 n=1 Tax=Dimorphilus gyrociliatus TaxID=2664684 RepID=A0A7I8WDF9_9ANNE|nr:DgyrCDS14404 [Dimorphilus gyrociliatus]
MNIIVGAFYTIKRIETVVNKAKNDGKDDIKFPQMKKIHFRCMEKGEEGEAAKVIVHGFSHDFSYFCDKKEFPSLEQFFEKSLKHDEDNTKDVIVAVNKENKEIAGICKLRDSNKLEKTLSLSETLKTLSIRTAFRMITTILSFDEVNSQIVKDEQVVEYLTVHDNYKKQGIARNLLRYAECMAKQRNSKV